MKSASPERKSIEYISKEPPSSSSSSKNYLVHLIVCTHLAITIPLAAILNIWTDEAYSLETTGKGLQYAITQAINFELQPPLYFAFLNIWRSVNGSIFWARLPSIIAIAATIYLVSLLAKKLIMNINPVWVVALFAFNPFTIKLALEIRVYSFVMLLSSLLLLTFVDGYLAQKTQAKSKFIYIILAMLALYTQYYLACLLIANGVVLLVLRRWQALKKYTLGMILVAGCFAPMLFFLSKQVSSHSHSSDKSFWQNFSAIQQSKVSGFVDNFSSLPLPLIFTGVALLIGFLIAFIFITDLHSIKENHLAIWTINITSVFFFAGVLVATNGFLLFRHIASVFIAFYFGLLLLLSLIKYSRIRNTVTIFLSVVVLLLYAQNLTKNYSGLAKAGDWNRVSEYIENSEQPQQEILVFTSISAKELAYHYDGVNQIIPLPKEDDLKVYDLQNYALSSEAEIEQALVSDRHDLWLVERVNRNCKVFDTDLNCNFLEDFVSKNYNVKTTKKFYKSRVRFLEHK